MSYWVYEAVSREHDILGLKDDIDTCRGTMRNGWTKKLVSALLFRGGDTCKSNEKALHTSRLMLPRAAGTASRSRK